MTNSRPSHPATVLIVEDDPDHAFLIRESFQEARVEVDWHHVQTGDRAMAFLRREPPFEQAPRPDLILLDLHMPRMSGHEVMEAISRDDSLKLIPVVVMTTSSSPEDIKQLYALGCKSYVNKPVDFGSFTEAARLIADYWLVLVVRPPNDA